MPAVDPPANGGGKAGGFFSRRVFGMKTWQLMLGLTIAVLAWALYRQRKGAASTLSTSAAATGTAGTNAQYTPPYVIQTDVNEAPVNVTDTTTVDEEPGGPAGRPKRRRRPIQGGKPPRGKGGPIPLPPVSAPPPSSPPPVKSPPPPPPRPTAPKYTVYRVKPGDNLTNIARSHRVFLDNPNPGLALYNYQLTPGLRSAADDATLRQRGPNLIYSNEEIYIPNQ